MVLEILVCALATGGILLFLWGLIGFLVYPRGQEAILVYCISGEAPYLESYLHWIGWLCQTGLLHAKIIFGRLWFVKRGTKACTVFSCP